MKNPESGLRTPLAVRHMASFAALLIDPRTYEPGVCSFWDIKFPISWSHHYVA